MQQQWISQVEPFADDWCSMATKYLKEKYDNDYITMTNASVGGMDSAWGIIIIKMCQG